tara:strand:- start:2668 stop:3507 length:840 start_codon:yes stop_codon:yes gene_type:complete
MSIKSLAQIIIILVIFLIIGSVYYNYFYKPIEIQENFKSNIEKKVVSKKADKLNNLDDKVENKEVKKSDNGNQEKILNKEIRKPKEDLEIKIQTIKEGDVVKNELEKKIEKSKEEVTIKPQKDTKDDIVSKKNNLESTNILTEVEYLTTDNKGNKYKIFAKSAKTSKENKDVLELDQVRGIVSSDIRSNVYIVSDFAKYNSSNLNSLFYQNVVINFEDKQIDCDYFDLDMQTNIAVAYSNVIVTDPKSIMKAGRITFDMKTKDIDIVPEIKKKIEVKTN